MATETDPRPSGQQKTSTWYRLARVLSQDAIGGALLLGATIIALVLANTPIADGYFAVRDFTFGIPEWRLDLSVGAWAADGLLAIFFFVVGLELKEEFVAGKLRNPRAAAVPIAGAVGGVIVPAVIFTLINLDDGADALRGWAIPTATDIAFAVAVIAVVGRFLPPALRTFLLTLAIVDDLIAITIIAVFYTDELDFLMLGLALIPLAIFTVLVQRGVRSWWLLLPLAFATWTLIHASGVHATVAGVLLGFAVPVLATPRARVDAGVGPDGQPRYHGLAEHFAERWSPLSAGLAVPIFAFFSAGVAVGGLSGLATALQTSIAIGVIVGLIAGKFIGILAGSWLITRIKGIDLDPSFRWIDLVGMTFIAGIGFTVSLLVGELAFGQGSEYDDDTKIGVLVGSFISAIIGSAILSVRNRHYRKAGLDEAELSVP
ncbi:Na+/H+ antiporter NhaA [Marisediminicola sp. LYQ85]|uniref:Na+/H+ antiporter NhaA n=1 Tax=Marisediminicola sp. LYQ85 TaxID=3391062 RepID=UPI00398302E0